jgi:hypothetical protein
MATKKRVKISHDVKREIRKYSDRTARPKKMGTPEGEPDDGSYSAEGDITRLQESERFSWQEAQGDFIPLSYAPTKSSWPANGWDHRRTTAAGYDRSTGILRIEFFTDGAIYDYGTLAPVPPYVAYQFRQTQSPGRFINSTLETYGYSRIN